jgi:hypothetical protein
MFPSSSIKTLDSCPIISSSSRDPVTLIEGSSHILGSAPTCRRGIWRKLSRVAAEVTPRGAVRGIRRELSESSRTSLELPRRQVTDARAHRPPPCPTQGEMRIPIDHNTPPLPNRNLCRSSTSQHLFGLDQKRYFVVTAVATPQEWSRPLLPWPQR